MFQSFRLSMTWLHTWFGLVLGYVLVVVFFFGALSVFDREIDRWAIPETRFEPQPMPSFDAMLESTFRSITKPDEDDLEAAKARVVGPIPEQLPLLDWSAYTTHRDPVLARFDLFVVELFHVAAVKTDKVVVVRAGVELVDGLAGLEVVAVQQAGLLELGQDAVDGGQADVHIVGQQDLVDILRRQVPYGAVLEDFQDFQARQGGLQAAGLQVGRVVTHVLLLVVWRSAL